MWSHCTNASSAQTEIAPPESKQHISFIKKKEKKIARVRLLDKRDKEKLNKRAGRRGTNAQDGNLCKYGQI